MAIIIGKGFLLIRIIVSGIIIIAGEAPLLYRIIISGIVITAGDSLLLFRINNSLKRLSKKTLLSIKVLPLLI